MTAWFSSAVTTGKSWCPQPCPLKCVKFARSESLSAASPCDSRRAAVSSALVDGRAASRASSETRSQVRRAGACGHHLSSLGDVDAHMHLMHPSTCSPIRTRNTARMCVSARDGIVAAVALAVEHPTPEALVHSLPTSALDGTCPCAAGRTMPKSEVYEIVPGSTTHREKSDAYKQTQPGESTLFRCKLRTSVLCQHIPNEFAVIGDATDSGKAKKQWDSTDPCSRFQTAKWARKVRRMCSNEPLCSSVLRLHRRRRRWRGARADARR